MEKMRMESRDGTQLNVEKIAALFPNCVTEAKGEDGSLRKVINFDMLRQMLSGDMIEGDEAYEFTWVGKKAAIVEANKPIRKTLRPCPEESVNWDTTENLYIEGDNLDVLKLLQESYLGKVKMIYIDPPYNTGSDSFVYPDNYAMEEDEFEDQVGMLDHNGNKLFIPNTDTNPRFHSVWCSMLYTRLTLARNLLKDDGIIFISIDNNEFANLKNICDTVFGEQSFVTVLHIQMSTVQGQKVRAAKAGNIVKNGEFVFVYSKNGNKTIGVRPLLDPVKYDNHYNKILVPVNGGRIYEEKNLVEVISERNDIVQELLILNLIPASRKLSSTSLQEYYECSPTFRNYINKHAKDIVRVHDSVDVPSDFKEQMCIGKVFLYQSEARSYMVSLNEDGTVTQRISLGDKLSTADDFYSTYGPTTMRGDWWAGFYLDMGNVSKEGGVNYDNGKKPVRLIRQLVEFCTDENDIVLDFFSGSATTAQAVMEQCKKDKKHRKFIMIQMPEDLDATLIKTNGTEKSSVKSTIKFLDSVHRPHMLTEIGKERICRVGSKIAEEDFLPTSIDDGFRVFKLDSTNMKDVYYAADEITQQNIMDMASNIKEDRTSLDLLFGCLLEWGLPLSLPYTSETIDSCTVHTYNDGDLIACFDENIPDSVIKAIANRQPLRAVFRDSSFADSPAKINVGEIFKLLAPDTRVKVI